MILNTSLMHAAHYHFRLHKEKLTDLCSEGFQQLEDYLLVVMKNCPSIYFQEGPRSSVLKFSVGASLEELEHEVSLLARMGLESNYYDNAHMNVQMFMLSYDNKTIGIEIPIWLHKEEFENFEKILKSELPLSGHIDLVRIEDGKIWIWDYKPNAHREKYASTQTYFYAIMLSKRTGIPLEHFRCGYFDDKNTYVFDPNLIRI